MDTYDTMSDADYQACQDAGRGRPPDPRDTADQERKTRREHMLSRALPVTIGRCPTCDTEGPVRSDMHGDAPYFVDDYYETCGHVIIDREGGL